MGRMREDSLKGSRKAGLPILGTEKGVGTLSIESMLRKRRGSIDILSEAGGWVLRMGALESDSLGLNLGFST